MHYPNLVHRDWRGGVHASDALVMNFYMQHPHGRIASAAIRAMELFRERIHPHALAWINIGEGQSEPLHDELWKRIRKRTLEPEEPDQSAFIEMEDDPRWFAGFCANYRGLGTLPLPYPFRKDDVSVLYFRMPTGFLVERGPKYVHALALELAAELPFNSGYADFVLCSSRHELEKALSLICPRYPGMHVAWDHGNIHHINTWVDGVHWMNFLGQPVLRKLGGIAGLREHLDLPGISLHEMSGERVLITLGDAPETGDLEAGQSLPLHRALARLLEPHLFLGKSMLGEPGPEALARWERRFLD
jgi:TseV toxin immunity protein TsiV